MKWLVLVAAAMVCVAAAQEDTGPVQPLPFSHKQHAGTMKLQCKMCHVNPDPGEMMTFAKPSICMQCHSSIKADSPAIQRLAQADQGGRAIPWVRVYQIPSYVNFSHRKHLEKGNACQDCHGQVPERERLYREGDVSMGGCMECHRVKHVSTECTFCHEQR